jgi:hypothetical protein
MRRREMGAEVRNRAAVIVRPRLGQVPRLYQGFPHQAERGGAELTRRNEVEPSKRVREVRIKESATFA